MADLVFVQPKTGLDIKGVTTVMPLGALHTVSLVDKEYEVKLIDQRMNDDWKKDLIQEIKKKPVCICLSVMTGAQIQYGLELTQLIMDTDKDIPIIWGGVHASLLPTQTLKHPLVNLVVIGEGETSLLELVNAFKEGKDISTIKGIGFKKDGKITVTQPRPFENLNALPDAAYHLVNVEDYIIQQYDSPRMLSFLTGRGCPYRCSYCYNLKFNDRQWRPIDAQNLVNRLKKLMKYHPDTVEFVDDLFFVSKKRAEDVCKLILEEGIKVKLVANCRIDYIAKHDMEFLKLIKSAGFHELYIGLESGSKRTLENIKKDSTLEQVDIANKKLKEVGIKPIYSFMGGFPGETSEDIKQTIDLMVKLNKENPDASLTSIKIFTPFPGTPLFDVCKQNGFKVPETLEGWAKFDYTTAIYQWGTKKDMALLKKLAFMTFFLDQKTIMKQLGKGKPVLKFFMKIYAKVVKARCEHNFYSFTPEIRVMEFAKNRINSLF